MTDKNKESATDNISDLRKAYSQFPTGVTVITCTDKNNTPVGVTASSFNTVSLDPPLILWSVDKKAFSASIFTNSKYFAVNVLAENQVALSNKFAGRGTDKFANVNYSHGVGDSLLLDGAIAQFECKTWKVYEGGDHLIIVGEIIKQNIDLSNTPLVFSQGSYAAVTSHPEMMKDKTSSFKEEEDFLSGYMPYLLRKSYHLYSQKLYPFLKEKYGVSPEQWRVIIALNGKESSCIEDVANLVMQSVERLEATINELVNLGIVNDSTTGFVKLTEQGRIQGQELKCATYDFEQDLFSKFTTDKSNELRTLLQGFMTNLSL